MSEVTLDFLRYPYMKMEMLVLITYVLPSRPGIVKKKVQLIASNCFDDDGPKIHW